MLLYLIGADGVGYVLIGADGVGHVLIAGYPC